MSQTLYCRPRIKLAKAKCKQICCCWVEAYFGAGASSLGEVLCGSFSKSTAESVYLCSCCLCSEWSVGDPEIRCARWGINKEKHKKAVRSETQNKKAAQTSQTSSNASLHLATSGLSFGDDASCPSCGVVLVVSSEPDKGDMNESDRRICISCELILVPSSRRAVRSLLSKRSVSMFSSSVTPIF